ncbi:MAG: SUMF1/EgtB/PvdO family nonheme iron enzyme, partial [Magnetococcales bacterium]|nr:SUMF1/EgtB/PvdO family nonheme iron enzyme [Magnetococcales bacterium]
AEINTPFLVQSDEVKLGDFKKYAEYVEDLPASKEKDRLMVRLGVAWKKNDSPNSSVNAVSWEGARDYAHWLGQRTGCSYDIPSQDEWLATVSYLKARDKIRLNGSAIPTGPLKNLLWGVREWSRSRCSSGYYLLGRDDFTASTQEDGDVCMPAMFAVAGFRVIMTPASLQN